MKELPTAIEGEEKIVKAKYYEPFLSLTSFKTCSIYHVLIPGARTRVRYHVLGNTNLAFPLEGGKT